VERRRIREAVEGEGEEVLRPVLDRADSILDQVRCIGDAVCAAFFTENTARARQGALGRLADDYSSAGDRWRAALRTGSELASRLAAAGYTFRPFHWSIEFPEVFEGDNPGFDAVVGNPPFAGKNTIQSSNPPGYLEWLQALHPGSHGNADLCAHFFRRAGSLLRQQGAFGLIATNTIRQGDTRESGLRKLLSDGFSIYAARRRLTWPGKAAVVVCVVHVARGDAPLTPVLDGREVHRISAYLVEGTRDLPPVVLRANAGFAFQGSILLGMGFTFDDDTNEPAANRLSERERVIAADPRNAECIRPYLGGEEVNDSPTQAHRRYAISFLDFPLKRENVGETWEDADQRTRDQWLSDGIVPEDYPEPVAEDWPDLLRIVRERVKPERDRLTDRNADGRRRKKFWWLMGRFTPGLYTAIAGLQQVLVVSRVTPQWALALLPGGMIFAETLVVFPNSDDAYYAVLQSRVHEVWTRFFASSLEDRLRYTPDDCLATFPFPDTQHRSALRETGRTFYEARAAFMQANSLGLTATHNRLDDPYISTQEIQTLRSLHDAMDAAVLRAYDWPHPIPPTIHEREWPSEPGERVAPWRRRWSEADREAILDFLWDLNRRRAEEEAAEAAHVSIASAPTPRRRRTRAPTPSQNTLLDI
jgi:hypothetical protein